MKINSTLMAGVDGERITGVRDAESKLIDKLDKAPRTPRDHFINKIGDGQKKVFAKVVEADEDIFPEVRRIRKKINPRL